jgi:general secretion pathway protein D
MIRSFNLFLIVLLPVYAFAQVPVQLELPAPVPPEESLPPEESPPLEESFPVGEDVFPRGILSDPQELANVDGLDDPLERIKLRDHDANMILDLIQSLTGLHILRKQDLPAVKISFDSMGILSKRETLLALDSLLSMNGIGITKIDDQFFKAVKASELNGNVPIWLDGPAHLLSPSQRIYIKMFNLRYAPVAEVREQLNPFATPGVGQLLIFEKANSILATDSLLNLQRMEKLLETIDRPVRKEDLGTDFFVWSTRHAGARELESKLKGMIDGSLKPFLGGTTQMDSDERTGKLIIITRKENKDTLWFFLEHLDAPVKMKTTSKLFKLQHAESKDIQSILDEVIKNQQRVKQQLKGKNVARSDSAQNAKSPPVPQSATKPSTPKADASAEASSGEGAHEFSDFVTISSDERSNAILVYGTKADIEEIGRMIESLDQPLPLARIDTIFVMVDLTEQNQRGIDALFGGLEWSKFARGARGDNLFGEPISGTTQVTNSDSQTGGVGNTTSTVTSNVGGESFQGILGVPGLNTTLPFQMQDWELTGIRWDQIFALSSERNDVRIFSTPSLMVSHNAPEVHILIEDERNIVVPTYSTYSSTDNTNTGQRDQITAKTELQIKKPKIGLPRFDDNGTMISQGSIFMEVEVKAEKFDETQSNTYAGQSLPAKKIREAKSLVTIRDREILVLGGLQEVQVDSTESKYNLLSDIPYFGEKFFRPKAVKYTPTELLIFLKPTIMSSGGADTERNIEEIDARIEAGYAPKFVSPSGRVLGMPDLDGKVKDLPVSKQDKPSEKPLLR